jgi:transposase
MIHDLRRQGLSVSAIARKTGLDRKTVRKHLAGGIAPPAYMCGRPPRRKSFSAVRTSVGCIHVFGLFAQHRMAAGPDEVRRLAP